MSSLFTELRRRNVFKVGAAYVVSAWLIAQVIDLAADAFAAPDWVMRMLIVVLALGFPVALFFAWAFELTPEGIKREEDVDRSQSITQETGQRLNRGIIIILSLAVILLLADKFLGSEGTSEPTITSDKSIAVLPFDDFSPGGDQGWFADGLTEEILNALARTADLRVASRTASFRYRDSTEPLASIAGSLGVQHILEGSVRRAGDDIRVTAQLIRASDGSHLWSENFDGTAADAIKIQEEISLSIARALKTAMDPEALRAMVATGTSSVDAYEAYLRGLSLYAAGWLNTVPEAYQGAADAFEQAREIDPGFARAHFRVAELRYFPLRFQAWERDDEDATGKAALEPFRAAMERAIEAADSEVERLHYQGYLAAGELRIRDAVRMLAEFLDQRPNEIHAYTAMVGLATFLGDPAIGLPYLDAMVDRLGDDPLALLAASYSYYRFGEAERGAAIARGLLASGTALNAYYQGHRALLWVGEVEEAAELLPRVLAAAPFESGKLLAQLRQSCAEGRREEAEGFLAGLKELPPGHLIPQWLGSSLLQEPTDATRWLRDQLDEEDEYELASLLQYPQFDPSVFPGLQAVLTREGIDRPEPTRPPYACDLDSGSAEKSVAVLPFVAMSSGEDDGYFADGLTEEILNALTALPDLLVTARTSSFAFKGKNLEIGEIARSLGVDHIVEGSVRRSGERVRITAQLVRADDGFHLWSDTYDRTLEDTFAIQEDIAQSIARSLDVVLDDALREQMARSGTRDVDAFINLQKGHDLYQRAHAGGAQIAMLIEANQFLDEAIEKAPRYADAYLLHSDLYSHLLMIRASGQSMPEEGVDLIDEARERLDHDLDMAMEHAVNGGFHAQFTKMILSDDWRRAQGILDSIGNTEECDRPLWLQIAAPYEREDRIRGSFDRLTRCDPGRQQAWVHASLLALWDGQVDRARRIAERGMERIGGADRVKHSLITALLAQGDFERAEALLASNTGAWHDENQIKLAAARGDIEEANRLAEEFWAENPPDDEWALRIAAATGQRERANALAAAIDARPVGPMVLLVSIYHCACGALFDLDATPNLQQRMREARFEWPPPTLVDYPAKDW